MNVLLVFATTMILFALAARLYGRLVERWLGTDPSRPTPSHTMRDGRDYVPTKPHILFGHHFASIAGAGPIVGPVAALIYGCGPVWVWIAIGAIFVGATHDFSALFVSVREGGRSMADAARRILGTPGYVLFILFVLVLIVLVTSSFLAISAVSLTSTYPLEKLGLPQDQTLLHTVERTVETGEGAAHKVTHGVIGGIASTSAVVVTLAAPLLGYLICRRGIRTFYAYVIAMAVCAASIWAGLRWPIQLDPADWMLAISIYTVFAAGLPVWMVLQPRDFVNVQILYAGVIALLSTVVAGGAQGMETVAPAFNLAEGGNRYGPVWPFVFIIVACGAISGFHAMVAGGTTAKQLADESHARKIGYNGMLLEGVLAVCVLLVTASGLHWGEYRAIMCQASGEGNPALAFSVAVGGAMDRAFGVPKAWGTLLGILMIEGFTVTTLDSAVRHNRYLLEELWRVLFGAADTGTAKYAAGGSASAGSARPAQAGNGSRGGGDGEGGVPGGVAGGIGASAIGTAAPCCGAGTERAPSDGELKRGVPWPLSRFWFNSGIAVLLMWLMARHNTWKSLWPLFGSGNQLLAALTLLTASLWLLKRRRQAYFTMIPAAFMILTTIGALVYMLAFKYLPAKDKNWTLIFADAALFCLASAMGAMAVRAIAGLRRMGDPAGARPAA